MAVNAVVIDSSPLRARQIAQRLRNHGCETALVASAEEALALLSAETGSVLFASCDIGALPLQELAERAKRASPDCTVVALFDQVQPLRPKGMYDPYIDEHLPYACRDHVLSEALSGIGEGTDSDARCEVSRAEA